MEAAAAEALCLRLERQHVDIPKFFAMRNPETGEFPHFRVIVDVDEKAIIACRERKAWRRCVPRNLGSFAESVGEFVVVVVVQSVTFSSPSRLPTDSGEVPFFYGAATAWQLRAMEIGEPQDNGCLTCVP